MKNSILLQSSNGLSVVKIDKGELVSYQKEGIEYLHQKENTGWKNTDTEMFPVIGPTQKNDFKIVTQQGINYQDQHGFLREMPYVLISSDENIAVFEKKYTKNTRIKNSKYPKKSTVKHLFWQYDFTFQKKIIVTNHAIEIQFTIHTEIPMPFMLGYHPAFLLSGDGNETFTINNACFTLQNVIDTKGDALPFYDVNTISLHLNSGKNIHVKTQGFNNVMLWTPVKNMVCIEPITQYPDLENQQYSEKNMRICNGIAHFSVEIKIY